MPKDYFQDITPPGSAGKQEKLEVSGAERSIRNIPIAPRRERGPHFPDTAPVGSNTPLREPGTQRAASSNFTAKRVAIWGSAGIALLALLFVAFALLQGTSVVVTPRTHAVVLAEDVMLSAYPANDERAALGSLYYDIAEKAYDAERSVTANGFSEVEEYASGIVTVYNEHSASPVRLIKNTRFESQGLVFRIRDSINIPGKKGDSPGTLTVTVYADQPGQKYNLPPTDRFTLPGLKGGDMYNNVYARSAIPFKGGFIGTKPKVSEEELQTARTALRGDLEQKARAEIAAMMVPGKLAFPQLMTLTFESLPFDVGTDGKALVRERVVAKLPLFPEVVFAKVLALATRADGGDLSMHLKSTEGIQVRNMTADAAAGTLGTAPIDILVSGNATLIWDVDAEGLSKALAGTSKADASFDTLITGFLNIASADAFIRPFWRNTFPSDPADISIVINEPVAQ